MLAVSVNSTHCFSAAAAAVRVAAAAAAVAAVFESCPRERGREGGKGGRERALAAPLLERALAARGADDRSAAGGQGGGGRGVLSPPAAGRAGWVARNKLR